MKTLKNKAKRVKAFTLIEMVIVIAIIALLILIIAPNLGSQKKQAESKTDQAFETTLETAYELYDKRGASFSELAEKGYLTQDQLKKSQDYTINEDGQVTKAK